MKKNIFKVLMCVGLFSMLFTVMAFASGGFNSTYWIRSTGGRPGVLLGNSHFNLSHNSMTVTIRVSDISHTAGSLNVILQRHRGGILGFGSIGASQTFHDRALTRHFTSGNSGTYRLRMWNENAVGVNQGNISVSSRR